MAFRLFGAYHAFLYRLTGGLVGHRVGKLQMLLLDHVGSKTPKRYTSPLLYGQDGDNFVLVASRVGRSRTPLVPKPGHAPEQRSSGWAT